MSRLEMQFRKRHAALAAGLTAAAAVPQTAPAAVTPVVSEDRALTPVFELAERAHAKAARRHVRLHRTNARLRGATPERTRRDVRDWSIAHLRDANAQLRRKNRRLRAQAPAATTTATPGHLQAIAACESGGDPSAVDATGTYRGKYQFDTQTWASVGGSGDPAAAPEAEQDARAAQLYAQRGSAPWPVCGG